MSPTWQPITAPSSKMGEGAACRADPLPCPVGEQTRGPRSRMNRGRPKGGGGSALPVLCNSWGLGPKGGGHTFRALPCVPHLRAEAGWREPCAWREGKQVGGTSRAPAGASRGARTGGAMRHQGGLFAPLPPCTPPACVFPAKRALGGNPGS
jgi:hypothetical protein